MVFNGLGLLAVIALIVAIYLVAHYVEWRHTDRRRREDRLIHLNLLKHTGRRA